MSIRQSTPPAVPEFNFANHLEVELVGLPIRSLLNLSMIVALGKLPEWAKA